MQVGDEVTLRVKNSFDMFINGMLAEKQVYYLAQKSQIS